VLAQVSRLVRLVRDEEGSGGLRRVHLDDAHFDVILRPGVQDLGERHVSCATRRDNAQRTTTDTHADSS